MIIREATFITSAADRRGFIETEKPLIAVCGKCAAAVSERVG